MLQSCASLTVKTVPCRELGLCFRLVSQQPACQPTVILLGAYHQSLLHNHYVISVRVLQITNLDGVVRHGGKILNSLSKNRGTDPATHYCNAPRCQTSGKVDRKVDQRPFARYIDHARGTVCSKFRSSPVSPSSLVGKPAGVPLSAVFPDRGVLGARSPDPPKHPQPSRPTPTSSSSWQITTIVYVLFLCLYLLCVL